MPPNSTPLSTIEDIGSRSDSRQDTSLQRAVAIIALLGIALIHLLDLPGKLGETPYLGVAFIGLIVASVVLAGLLAMRDKLKSLVTYTRAGQFNPSLGPNQRACAVLAS
jgi:hypothetical protein